MFSTVALKALLEQMLSFSNSKPHQEACCTFMKMSNTYPAKSNTNFYKPSSQPWKKQELCGPWSSEHANQKALSFTDKKPQLIAAI